MITITTDYDRNGIQVNSTIEINTEDVSTINALKMLVRVMELEGYDEDTITNSLEYLYKARS